MISIQCPKCGRGGSAPSDRVNTRLVCKACHTVFHLDNAGRIMLGDPESLDEKVPKPRKDEVPASLADFDLAQTWNDIPKPIRYSVPAALLALVIYLNLPSESYPDYLARGESIARAVVANNRSRAVSMATAGSADAAGKWFELLHAELEKSKLGSNVRVTPQVFSGNPEKESEVTLMVVVSRPGSSDLPVTVMMPMTRTSGPWQLDGTKGLEIAQKSAAAPAR